MTPSDARGSPQLRTMTLFDSSPAGTSASGDVRDLEQDRRELSLRLGELALEPADLLAERAAVRDQIVGRLAGPLAAGDFLRAGVARRLSLLDRLDEQAPVALESLAAIELRTERAKGIAPPHRLAQIVEALADQTHVVHQNVGIESGTSERKPQFPSMTCRTNNRRDGRLTLSTTNLAYIAEPLSE